MAAASDIDKQIKRLKGLPALERTEAAAELVELYRDAMKLFGDVRSRAVEELLDEHGGTRTAELLGVSRQQVYRLAGRETVDRATLGGLASRTKGTVRHASAELGGLTSKPKGEAARKDKR